MADWYNEIEKKKDNELDEIINSFKDSYSDVLRALVKVMKKREYRMSEHPDIENELENRKKIWILVQDTKVKTKTSFKWTPEFTSQLQTKLPKKIAINTVARAMIAMDWFVVHVEDNAIEAKRLNDFGDPAEKVIVALQNNKLNITSKSIKNNLCDFGKNSRRVEEFKLSYKEIESFYDESKIANELEEITQKEKEAEYQIPDELTKPERQKEKNISYLLGGGILLSLGLGGLIALFASLIYVIFLYDFLIGLITAIAFGYLIKLSNISNFNIVQFIGFASIGLSYFLSQVYRFVHIVNQNNISDASIMDYFNARLEQGLQYEGANLGMIGLIIAWIIELAIALMFYNFKVAQKVIKFDLERAPKDVVDFAVYWFNEGKDETGVRKELYNKGWYDKEQQDIIINAVGARVAVHDVQRN